MGEINWPQIAASFIAGQIALTVVPVARRWLAGFWGAVFFFIPAVQRFLRLKRFAASDEEFWTLAKSEKAASDYNIPPMVTFANFKGGVGKTTIAANVIASIAKKHSLKVLVFDLDYQGSLTSILCRSIQNESKRNLLERWIKLEDDALFSELVHPAQASMAGVFVVTSDYNIASIEERELIRWLINPSKKDDVRYRLIEKLNRYQNDVSKFDLIIADAPPRLSLSSVNGLVATSQVIVPTEPTVLATRPIGQMVKRLMHLRTMVSGKFRVAAIIFNKTFRLGTLTRDEKAVKKLADDTVADVILGLSDVQKAAQDGLPQTLEPNIVYKPTIARPDPETLAYLRDDEVDIRHAFDRLADQILKLARVPSNEANDR